MRQWVCNKRNNNNDNRDSYRSALAVPKTEFFEAVYASKPSPLLPDPKKIMRPLKDENYLINV